MAPAPHQEYRTPHSQPVSGVAATLTPEGARRGRHVGLAGEAMDSRRNPKSGAVRGPVWSP